MKARRRDPVTRPPPPAGDVPGFTARRVAADVLDGVLRRRRALDDEFEAAAGRRRRFRNSRGATVRSSGRSPLRCCAGWVRCATSSASVSMKARPRRRRASRRRCSSERPRFFSSMCRITPPSIFRCGSRRRTGKRHAMPVSSTPYCGASRAKGRSGSRRLDPAILDTPPWLMARWSEKLRRGHRPRHRRRPWP